MKYYLDLNAYNEERFEIILIRTRKKSIEKCRAIRRVDKCKECCRFPYCVSIKRIDEKGKPIEKGGEKS